MGCEVQRPDQFVAVAAVVAHRSRKGGCVGVNVGIVVCLAVAVQVVANCVQLLEKLYFNQPVAVRIMLSVYWLRVGAAVASRCRNQHS